MQRGNKIICTLYAIDHFYDDKLKLLRTKIIPKQVYIIETSVKILFYTAEITRQNCYLIKYIISSNIVISFDSHVCIKYFNLLIYNKVVKYLVKSLASFTHIIS